MTGRSDGWGSSGGEILFPDGKIHAVNDLAVPIQSLSFVQIWQITVIYLEDFSFTCSFFHCFNYLENTPFSLAGTLPVQCFFLPSCPRLDHR